MARTDMNDRNEMALSEMTWGEISELSAKFLTSLENFQQPEIDLKSK